MDEARNDFSAGTHDGVIATRRTRAGKRETGSGGSSVQQILESQSVILVGGAVSNLLDNAAKNKAWTAGGVQPPVDLSDKTSKRVCFTVEQASSSGWTPIELNGPEGKYYRCIDNKVTLQGNYPKPVTLADVGKTMDDLK